MSGNSEVPGQENPEDLEEVRVLTRSDELFQSAVHLAEGFPFRFVRDEGELFEPTHLSGLPVILLVDFGTATAPLLESLTLGGIVVAGKGASLLEAWEKYLLSRASAAVPLLDFENFLRDKVRSSLTRCEWPGGAYAFFQGILENVLISEALRMTDGNRQKTARLLGISRTTLRNRMQEKIPFEENSANAENRDL